MNPDDDTLFSSRLNVGGHVVKMEGCAGMFEEIGLINVETFIASGKRHLRVEIQQCAALRKKIRSAPQESDGYEVKDFIEASQEVAAMWITNPYGRSIVSANGDLLRRDSSRAETPDGKALMGR